MTPGAESASERGPSALRIAWIGAEPRPGAGAAGCGWLIAERLARAGCQFDFYVNGPREEIASALEALDGARVMSFDTGWRYDRWYSSHRFSKVVTGFGSLAWGRRRLAAMLLAEHRLAPYDVIYQFSTIEVFGLRRHLSELPPIVMHPGTHMAGELRWFRRERALATRCEPRWRLIAVEALLNVRTRRQRRDARLAERIIAISDHFRQDLAEDYRLDRARIDVVPNPIDLEELQPQSRSGRGNPWRFAFVSRMSTRKGVDLVIPLADRLRDLEGDVTLDLVGDHTLWSDYRPLLSGLDSRIATYRGYLPRAELIQFLREADVLLQPAKYEPFGLSVGEALALGVPVIASDQVGAAEHVDDQCCSVVPAGDLERLESAVRLMLEKLAANEGPRMGRVGRTEAERLFAPDHVARAVLGTLRAAVRRDARHP